MAITAWGLSPSGKYDSNDNVTGAAYVAEALMTLQSLPVDFAIFYKFDGINCDNLGYPCLVVGDSGILKPNAESFILHSRLLKAGDTRLDASCYYCKSSVVSALSNSTGTLAILVAGEVAPTYLVVKNWEATCHSNKSTLTVNSVIVESTTLESDADTGYVGSLSNKAVSGYFSGNYFYKSDSFSSDSEPYKLPLEVDAGNGYYSALLTVQCGTEL